MHYINGDVFSLYITQTINKNGNTIDRLICMTFIFIIKL